MKFGVGTTDEQKIKVVKSVLEELLSTEKITILTYASQSKVPETPWDHQTKDGARNRAYYCQEHVIADYYIGHESGLVQRYGDVYEEAWACVMNPKQVEYFGYSSGLKVPKFITDLMRKKNKEYSAVMTGLNETLGNDRIDDTWGRYSNNMILSDRSLQESLRNALVQIFSPKESLYHK